MLVFSGLLLFVLGTQATNWNSIVSKRLLVNDNGKTHPEARIVNGTQAERHQFPYHVGVMVDNAYLCGGSMITNSVVLTAAHCTYK
ncbi:hypothetical protein B566_EDAN011634 [Ephemera danica]|nr:hypothetical protein B566_EDAN011634 [Ephemera danica]